MRSGPTGTLTAYVDVAGARLADEQWMYALGAVLLSPDQHAASVARLRSLLMPSRPLLHHYDETPERRTAIAEALVHLPRLEHTEHVERVVLESRARSDKHDVRTRDRLRRSRSLSTGLRMDHEGKTAEPMTWAADFVVSSYMAAHHHGEKGPWKIISDAHVVEIMTR